VLSPAEEELLPRALLAESLPPRLQLRAALRCARQLLASEAGRAEVLDFEVMLWQLKRPVLVCSPLLAFELLEVCRSLQLEKIADFICSQLSQAANSADAPAPGLWAVLVDLAAWHAARGEAPAARQMWRRARQAPPKLRDPRVTCRAYAWRFDPEPGRLMMGDRDRTVALVEPGHAEGNLRRANGHHFRALMRKNLLLKKREWSAQCCPWCPFAACCELLLPLAVLALLWWAKSECASNGQCQIPILEGWGGRMPKTMKSTTCQEGLPLEDDAGSWLMRSYCNLWTKYYLTPRDPVTVLSYLHWSGERLALAVEHPEDSAKVERFRDTITAEWFPDLTLRNIPCVPLERDLLGKISSSVMGKAVGSSAGKQLTERARHLEENRTTLACQKKKVNPGVLPGFANLTHPKIFTAAELDTYLDSADTARLFGALVFHKVPGQGELGAPGDWAYSIRLNVSAGTQIFTRVPNTRPLDLGLKQNEAFVYMSRGFVSLQLLVDRYIIGWPSDVQLTEEARLELLRLGGMGWAQQESAATQRILAESQRYHPQALGALPMPVGGIVLDGFFELIALAFPLVFIVAFLYTQKKVLNELISEKETKVRESLRMLGVGSLAIISSWFVTYGAIFAALCAIFAVVSSFYVFPGSSTMLIFAFFWLWCMSFLAFAWFIHCFFNQSRTGGIVGMIIMFAQWIVYSSQNQEGPPSETVSVLLMLMPNAAFCTGLEVLAKFEAARVGAQWSNIFMEVRNTSFAEVLGMMCLDILLFTALGWYFDRVLPKEFGVRLPPHFFLQRSFWQSTRSPALGAAEAAELAADAALRGPAAQCAALGCAEEVATALRRRSAASGCVVRTTALRKEFQTPGGKKVAVEGLDLAMFDGQILALLGHNGAGKSTTINMLTGMVEPSSGDAVVAGHRLSDGLQEIRQVIGVCPQHDILWLELTVWEHLTIFAQLRGVPPEEVTSRASEMMQKVGLTEKARTRAGALSGGQKRKLSLCLALIGRPPVVFLDEPTSGMDPYSRRSTWNIIRAAREGRVVVLTTHFMDEADILGDRVAIMAEGRLCVCGSSLFLKARFGAGYRLTCSREDVAHVPVENDPIEMAVKRHVPDARRITDIGAELAMQLPSSATSSFHGLLTDLERNAASLGLAHYGLSMVKLEEVFLKVASGEMDGHPSDSSEAHPTSQWTAATLKPRVWRHLGALFMKRARYGRRDIKALACTVLMPVALLAFGLGILNVVGDRHMPALLIDVASQFGHTPVPFNVTGEFSTAAHVRLQPEQLTEGVADGLIFGRKYAEGSPVFELCEEKPSFLSKCWKENNICEHILPFLELASSVNMGIGCSTDSDGCKAAIQDACQAGAAQCTGSCLQRADISESICRSQCREVCLGAANYSKACDLLKPIGTVADVCPVECASSQNETCPVGTVCSLPFSPAVAEPDALLRMATLLFQQGGAISKRSDVRYGAVLTTSNSSLGTQAMVLYNTSAPHAAPAFVNLLSSALQQARGGGSISVSSHPMPRSRSEKLSQVVSAVVDLTSTFVIIIAFSWIPPAIVAYVVREREAHHNSKHQQLISGVSIFAYWTSNFLWDVCLYVLPLGFTMLFLRLFGISAFVDHGAFWASFVVFAGYGLAIAPFSYLLSFLFAKHTSAQIISLVVNFLTGLLLMLTSYILNLIQSTKDVNESLMWIYRLFPGFCLGHGLFEICTNSVLAEQFNLDVALLGWDVAGKDALFLYIAAPFYFVLAVLIDFLLHSPLAAASRHLDPSVQEEVVEDDADVAAEARRDRSGDMVRLEGLRKVYRTPEGAPKVAVHGLSFGLQRGECFGFLGING
ncbi:unnamed protein product, partial [Effrenium voratum]